MTAWSRAGTAAGTLIAFAVVFSPLIAALTGSGLQWQTLTSSVPAMAAPYAGSIGTAAFSAVIAVVIGVPFALLVERARPRLRRLCWGLGLLVLMVPPYITAEGWIVLLGPVGKISKWLALGAGLGPPGGDALALARFAVPGFVYTWFGVGMVMGGCLFPIVALAVGSALRRTDQRIFESARLAQGPGGVHRILGHILAPPAIGAALLVVAATLAEFAVPQLLRVRTVGEAVYERIQEGDLGGAAAFALPILPLVVGAGALGAYILVRARVASLAGMEGEVPLFSARHPGRTADWSALAVCLWAVIPGLIVPLTSLIWLTAAAHLPHPSGGGTHQVLRTSGFLNALGGSWELAHDDAERTVLWAVCTATLATAASIALVRALSRVGRGPVLGALGAGLAVPAPIVGLGLIVLWNHAWSHGVYQGPVVAMLAWLARFLPITVFLVQVALARVPQELECAAALIGRGPFERLRTIVIPHAAPGLACAWLATYVLSATEFSATLLIAPPGMPFLAPSVVNLMRRGQDPEIAACQFLLLGVIALPLVALVAVWLMRRRHSPLR